MAGDRLTACEQELL